MNELTVFNNEQFGKLRSTMIDGEPWFIAVDICKALDLGNTGRAVARLDKDEGTRIEITHPQNPEKTIEVLAISESGMYSLILGSRKQEAHLFKRWITHEVIPSLRKHGAYVVGQNEMTREQLLAKAYEAMIEINEESKNKISALTEANTALLKLTADNAPKVAFADSVSETGGEILIGELAKLMHQNGIDIGQNRLYRELREDGYIMQNGTIPTQKGMEKGWFRIIERPVTIGNGQRILTQTTKVTVKGQVDLINKFYEKHIDDIF